MYCYLHEALSRKGVVAELSKTKETETFGRYLEL